MASHGIKEFRIKKIDAKGKNKNGYIESKLHDSENLSSSVIDINDLACEKVNEVEQAINNASGDLTLCNLENYFSVLRRIITAADLHRSSDKEECNDVGKTKSHELAESIYADYTDDNEQFNPHGDLTEQLATNSVKWTIRVKAFRLVHRLIRLFVDKPKLLKAKLTVLKLLPDLIRLSFVSATSPYDELKIQGYEMIYYIIDRFSHIQEKEFVGHSILEQYKTQILSAIKPAFNLDAPPYITAIATQISSLWICQGLDRDPIDVKKVHQLMLLSIEKLDAQNLNQNSKLYTECELEQERVSILGAWAQIYIASKELKVANSNRSFDLSLEESENLESLINPLIFNLVDRWWEALKDYALLIMPSTRLMGSNLNDDGNVYTREVALRLFQPNWPKIVLALTMWLCTQDDSRLSEEEAKEHQSRGVVMPKYAKFIFGLIMKELCNRQLTPQSTRLPPSTTLAVRSLDLMLCQEKYCSIVTCDLEIAQEFFTLLYNVTISYGRDPDIIMLCKVLERIFTSLVEKTRSKIGFIYYALVRLICQTMSVMKHTALTVKHKEQASDIRDTRIQMSLILKFITIMIKAEPKKILAEAQLLEAILMVFQELLSFDMEPAFVLLTLKHISELYPILPACNQAYFISSICEELCKKTSTISESLYREATQPIDKTHSTILEASVRSLGNLVQLLSELDRSKFVEKFIEGLLQNIDIEEDLSKDRAKPKRELLSICLEHINLFGKSFDGNFEESMGAARKKYDDVLRMKKDLETKSERASKQRESSISKKLVVNPTRKATKITLKADFSNFYGNKAQ